MVKQDGMIMMTEKEYEKEYKNITENYIREIYKLETRNEILRKAVMELMKKDSVKNNDVKVSKVDFLKIYDTALNDMFDTPLDEDNDIYGYDFTIHWHGIYCNCGDGATPSNHIIPAIECCNDEDDDEY